MSQKVLKEVTHCIFDMDGLLLDTERLYWDAMQTILSRFGKTLTFDVMQNIMGLQTREVAEFMVNQYDLPMTWQQWEKEEHDNAQALMMEAQLMAGAERLLRHLSAHKVPLALATSSGADMVKLKTTHHAELFKLFNHRVCGSTDKEVENGKPAPDIFLVAASRFTDTPSATNCLVFEDSPNGVTAAHSAGMQVVMVPDPRTSTDLHTSATMVLRSLQDFEPESFGLPAFGE